MLLAHLPTSWLENVTNKAAWHHQISNLYHACMGKILQPLQDAGLSGIFMTSRDGLTWQNHLLFACFIGDYPKQILVTCVPTGKCPTCPKPCDELGKYNPDEAPGFQDLEQVLTALDSFENDPGGFLQTCAEARIKPVVDPFWKDLPYTHIYRSITPNILHQLYQGVLKPFMCHRSGA